jgi:hypothetical protein
MSPLSGLLGNLFHRGALLALGTLLWAAFSVGFGLSRTYAQVSYGARAPCQALQPPAVLNMCWHSLAPACLAQAVSLAACTGIGMALVSPNAQSLIADLYPAAARGRSFGATLMIVCLGASLSSRGGACGFRVSMKYGIPVLQLRAETAHTEAVPACTRVHTDQEGQGGVNVFGLPCHAAVWSTLRMSCGLQRPLQLAHEVAGAPQAAWLADSLQSASATGALVHWRCGLGLSSMPNKMGSFRHCYGPCARLSYTVTAGLGGHHQPNFTASSARVVPASPGRPLACTACLPHSAVRARCRAGSWRTLSWRASARSHARWWCWAWRSRGARRAWACAPRCAGAPAPCWATCGPCCACAGAHAGWRCTAAALLPLA